MNRIAILGALLCSLGMTAWLTGREPDPATEWPEYLGGPDRNHYSTLHQINTDNVSQLKPVWEFHTGDSGQVQCNSIIVGGMLYGVTASNQLFALDAATGKERWRFAESGGTSSLSTNRGVVYWRSSKPGDTTPARILYAYGSSLYAIKIGRAHV